VHEVDDRRLGADLVEVLLWMHDVSDPRLIHDSCEVRRLDGRALVHLSSLRRSRSRPFLLRHGTTRNHQHLTADEVGQLTREKLVSAVYGEVVEVVSVDRLKADERLAGAGHSGDENQMARFRPSRLVDDLPNGLDGRLCGGPGAIDASKFAFQEQLSSRLHESGQWTIRALVQKVRAIDRRKVQIGDLVD
jgi:hypothetical protein